MFRFMRLIVFFDLPTKTKKNRRDYTRFRKFLIKSGFLMMQESVYSKLVMNGSHMKTVKNQVIKNKPPAGNVQMLAISEKQYLSIETIVGKLETDVLNNFEKTVLI